MGIITATVLSITGANATSGPHHNTPLCKAEDDTTQQVCFWDADRQGNKQGKSFYSFNFGEQIVYVK